MKAKRRAKAKKQNRLGMSLSEYRHLEGVLEEVQAPGMGTIASRIQALAAQRDEEARRNEALKAETETLKAQRDVERAIATKRLGELKALDALVIELKLRESKRMLTLEEDNAIVNAMAESSLGDLPIVQGVERLLARVVRAPSPPHTPETTAHQPWHAEPALHEQRYMREVSRG